MNLNQIWQTALGTIQMQTSRQDFDAWLRGAMLLSLDSGMATIGTTTASHKEELENRYMAPLRRALGDVVGIPIQVRFVVAPNQHGRITPSLTRPPLAGECSDGEDLPVHEEDEHDGYEPVRATNGTHNGVTPTAPYRPSTPQANNQHMVQLDLSSAIRSGMLNSKYTFTRFIVGSSNQLAHAASLAVAERPSQSYNPLFLYGGVGLGKTHLLHAIGNYVLDRDPEINVLYVSSEKFTNDLINAIRRQQTEEFRIRYRNIDILLIDDIQFIAGKDATQEEFFHTFNTLHSAMKQIVISSDRPPKAIITLEERLRSRFEWGLIVDVQPPDLETRTAILRAKAENMNVPIPNNVIDFLAHKIQSNIRELEGCLNRVAAYAELHRMSITVDVAATALAELLDGTRRKRISANMVLQTVSNYYSVDINVLQSRGRSRNIVVPRQIAMYLLREETGCSLMEIGNILGGRDHTTVMHGCEKISQEINTDTRLRNEVLTIREKLYQMADAK